MKNILLRIAAVVIAGVSLLTTGVGAQETEITMGVKTGISLGDMYGDGVEAVNPRLGYIVGGYLEVMFNEHFVILPEFLYWQRGGDEDGEFVSPVFSNVSETFTGKRNTKLNYIDAAMVVKYRLLSQRSLNPYVFVAPTFAVLVSAEESFEGNSTFQGDTIPLDQDIDIKESVNNTDFLISVGAGIDFELSDGKMSIEARYTLGLTEWFDPGVAGDIPSIKLNALAFTVGYSLP